MGKRNEKVSTEIEIIEISKQILELRNIRNEMKDAIKSINRRLNQAEERICDIEYRSFEIFQSEENKAKRMKKSEENLQKLWDAIMRNNLYIIGVP